MNHESNKRIVRKNTLKAAKLYKQNAISREMLRFVAASALNWEISSSMERSQAKLAKIESGLDR